MTDIKRLVQRVCILVALFAAAFHPDAQAQKFDYNHFPRLDFRFDHMTLELEMDPGELFLKGRVGYRVTSNIEGADTLVLEAAHMEIEQVLAGDTEVDYKLHNDSLFVPLPPAESAGREYEVVVEYSTSPRFGLLQNSNGTIWTSLLPGTTRHWVPVADHPRVAFTVDMSITLPSGLQVVAPGTRREEEVVSVDRVRHRFSTGEAIPASALAFAVGAFEHSNAGTVHLASEQGLLSREQQSALLEQAREILGRVEKEVQKAYPYGQLSVVVLDDHMWERTSWGASVVYLYRNRGSLSAQLRRGIYAQYFGLYQREEQWSNALGTQLNQAALHFRLTDRPALLKVLDEPENSETFPYNTYSVDNWNRWQRVFSPGETAPWKQVIARNVADVLDEGEGVFTYYDYASYWYRDSGQPLFNFVPPDITGSSDPMGGPDSIHYRVDYSLTQRDNSLKLRFTAIKGQFTELVTLPMVQYLPSGTDTSEVTFTGAADSLVVRVSPMAQSVDIKTVGRERLYLDQVKPAPFLLYDLRNSGQLELRIRAAENLGSHADNPDLQLAIMDYLKKETEPGVKAALLSSLSRITRGAAGIQKIFLDALQSDHSSVRLAALEALTYYGDGDAIPQDIHDFAMKADSVPIFRKAVDILADVSTPDRYTSFVNSIIRTDTAGTRAIYAVKKQAVTGSRETAVANASNYLNPVFDYPVRSEALEILVGYDQTPADWEKRITGLLDDRDPRIRYLAVQALGTVSGLDAQEILSTRVQDEYDARVYKAMRNILGN